MPTLLSSLFGLQPAATRLATPIVAPVPTMMNRRGFLATIGGLTVAAIAGCGTESGHHDAGPITGGDGGADAGMMRNFLVDSNFARIPCQISPDIDVYAGLILGTATWGGSMPGDHNHLYDLDPTATARPIPSNTRLELPNEPSRFLNCFTPTTGGKGIVTANDGFYEVNPDVSSSPRFIAYPAGKNTGGGASYSNGKLFIPVANLSGTSYGPGQVLVYDVDSMGVVGNVPIRSIDASRLNPTGTVLRDANTVAVLNSGDFTATSQASIDLISVSSMTILDTIPLGGLTAQVSGELALATGGRTLIVGTAAYDTSSSWAGKLLFVDLVARTAQVRILPGTLFHSSVKIDSVNNLLYVTDFNAGTIIILDLTTGAILQEALRVATGMAGPSEIYNGALIQAVPYGAVRIYFG